MSFLADKVLWLSVIWKYVHHDVSPSLLFFFLFCFYHVYTNTDAPIPVPVGEY